MWVSSSLRTIVCDGRRDLKSTRDRERQGASLFEDAGEGKHITVSIALTNALH
jgi:hypothetical protein